MSSQETKVCPVELSGTLESRLRKWLHNPKKILSPHIKEGMTILDVGCGPGFFSLEIAAMAGPAGRIICADLQQGMLDIISRKIKGTELEGRIKLVKCDTDKINVVDKVDLVFAFFMVHEVPDKQSLFAQLKPLLKDGGQILIIEPKYVHVPQKDFAEMIQIAEGQGLKAHPGPKLFMSQTVILKS